MTSPLKLLPSLYLLPILFCVRGFGLFYDFPVLDCSQLLLKPVEYNLVESRLTQSAEQNLRIISTIFIYMLRRLWGQSNKPMVRSYYIVY